MTTILIKDALRQSVEAASGGKQTVMYTAKGQPTYMNIITRKNMEELYPSLGLSGVHQAFKMGDKTLSRIYIGTYPAALVNGELLSLPYRDQAALTASAGFGAAIAAGSGHHLMTGAEKSLLQGLFNRDGWVPFAAGSYGINTVNRNVGIFSGVRVDGREPGDTTAMSNILTGSGPTQFRTGNKFNGLSDVHNGDNRTWSAYGTGYYFPGDVRFFDDEIQVMADNSAAAWTNSSKDGADYLGSEWQAFDAASGALKNYSYTGAPGTLTATTASSVRFNNNGPTNSRPGVSIQLNAQPNAWVDNTRELLLTSLPDAVLAKLVVYGIIPPGDYTTSGQSFKGTGNLGRKAGLISNNGLSFFNGPWSVSIGGNIANRKTFRTAFYSASDLS